MNTEDELQEKFKKHRKGIQLLSRSKVSSLYTHLLISKLLAFFQSEVPSSNQDLQKMMMDIEEIKEERRQIEEDLKGANCDIGWLLFIVVDKMKINFCLLPIQNPYSFLLSPKVEY